MIFVKTIVDALASTKREGTSQTYGQYITISSESDSASISATNTIGQQSAVSAKNILVKVISNNQPNGSSLSSLNDTDRSKISIAAFSDTKNPTVALNQVIDGSNSSQSTSLPSLSKVVENNGDFAIVVGSSFKSSDDIKNALNEAKKVDLMITLKSKESEVLEFNNLEEVSPDIDFTYNFFEETEEDIELQEDQSQDPLLTKSIFDVPKYVKLSWESVVVDNKTKNDSSTSSRDIQNLRKSSFSDKKGVLGFDSTNFKDSFIKSKKDTSLHNIEGVKVEITDIHALDSAMNSTSNKQVFSNTINAVFDVSENTNIVNILPIKVKDSK